MARRKAQLGLSVTDGGTLTPIGKNIFLAQGRTHAQGGIGLTFGKRYNPAGDLEIEKDEIVEIVGGNNVKFNGNKKFKGGGQEASLRVFSSVPLLRGVSPAQLVMAGYDTDTVFKAQEEYKDRNRINDDGTRYQTGGEKIYTPSKSIQRQIQETGRITIGGAPTIGGLRTRGYISGLSAIRRYAKKGTNVFTKGINNLDKKLQSLVNENKISDKTAQFANNMYKQFIGKYGENIPKTVSLAQDDNIKKTGGIYIKPSKRGTFTAAAKKRGMAVQEFASKVLANKEDYSTAMVKKANFARNASRWKKEYGGDDTRTAALKRLRAKYTVEGDYGGGMFGGAGAGSIIMNRPEYVNDTITKRYLVPVTQTFNDAFRNARNSGQSEFMFDGNLYNTNLSDNPNNNAAGARRTQTVIVPIEHKEVKRRKKEFGGGMIYTINGNVKNGLGIRPKAKYGKIDRKDKDIKVGPDGLIYKRDARGEWWTDGTKHVAFKEIENSTRTARRDIFKASDVDKLDALVGENDKFISTSSSIPTVGKKINLKLPKPKRTYVGGYDEEEKETKKIGSLTYEKNESGKWVPSAKQSTTTTRDGGRPKDFGMTRTGVNHPNSSYKYHPLTGEKISEIGVVETSEPSVKGTTKVTSKSSSTPRGRGTKASTPKAAVKTTTKGADTKYGTPLKEKKESLYMTGIKNNSITPLRAGMEKIKSPSSTGGGTQSKDGRWIGQYKTTNVGDWIGLGSNLAGSVASYFMTKNAINKMPDPVKPVMAQAAKLKTRYNIEPQLIELREAEQMNRAAVRRNTQSSNVSLAREQRLLNEARGARNQLYGQKENIETQLINQDRLNRQSVMRDNVRAYNDYLNRLTATRQGQNQLRISNINNLLSGLTGSVNNIFGTIESRRATNNTLRAIAAANPNVDARLIGGFDYYIDPITKRKYNKNQQYIGTING